MCYHLYSAEIVAFWVFTVGQLQSRTGLEALGVNTELISSWFAARSFNTLLTICPNKL